MEIKFTKAHFKYGCFSNFVVTPFTYLGIEYTCGESAFQAQKSLDLEERKRIAKMLPSAAKKAGRSVPLRNDWERVKYNIMVDVVYCKFSQSPELKEILLSTGDAVLIEDTTGWHDNIWGNCDCPKCVNKVGQNLLGKALMQVRETLRLEPNV